MLQKAKDALRLDGAHKKLAVWLLVSGAAYVLPIILADRYYNDDLGRILWGATGWVGDGRPLTEYLILFLTGGAPVVDIAPLPLLLSVLMLALALAFYAQRVLGAFRCDGVLWYALFLVLANPLLLPNLSYRFDCLTMIGGLALALFVFALLPELPWPCAVAAGVAFMAMYQPLLGFCIGLWCIDMLLAALQKSERPVKTVTGKALCIGLGAVAYMALLAPHLVDPEGWRHDAAQLAALNGQLPRKMYTNLYMTLNHIRVYLSSIAAPYKAAFALLFLLGWGAALYACCRQAAPKHRWLRAAAAALAPAVCLVMTMAPFTVLENFSVSTRLLIAFSAVLLLAGVYLAAAGPRVRVIIAALLIPCAVFHYSYMYTYGNALSMQTRYEAGVGTRLAGDLGTLAGGGPLTVTFVNELSRPLPMREVLEKYPNFRELITPSFGNSTWLGGAQLYWYLPGNITLEGMQPQDQAAIETADPVFDNSTYQCWLIDGKAIVLFK